MKTFIIVAEEKAYGQPFHKLLCATCEMEANEIAHDIYGKYLHYVEEFNEDLVYTKQELYLENQ